MNEQTKHIIGKYFPVLDYGFLSLVDVMGDDSAIEQAARVSYGAGTRKVSQTRGLIRYLMRHRHTTPFEMVELKFHVGMPMFVARQWIRHRTANVNEYSGRYSVMPDLYYLPSSDRFREQSKSNKQGSGDKLSEDLYEEYVNRRSKVKGDAIQLYEDMLGKNVAREIARIDLPVTQYTTMYWKIDLHNLFHFLSLRCDSHAQYEIRQYANIMAGMVERVVPLAFEAWVDYDLCSHRFSRQELQALHEGNHLKEDLLSKREVREYEDKTSGVPEVPDFSLNVHDAKDSEYFNNIWSRDEDG